MSSKISQNQIKNWAIVLFFIGFAFMLAYNSIAGYHLKEISGISDDELGKKVKVCGIVESAQEVKSTMFLKLKEENSSKSINAIIFQKDQSTIDMELSEYNYSLLDLSNGDYICIEGRYEKYNGEAEIIVKRISEIECRGL